MFAQVFDRGQWLSRRDPQESALRRHDHLRPVVEAELLLDVGDVRQRITAATFALWMLVASARAAFLAPGAGRRTTAERPTRRNVRFAR